VTEVVVLSSRPTVLSRIERLQLTYTGPTEDAPTNVILKTLLPERLGKSNVCHNNEVDADP
jgi:hypothetical protein